MQLPEVDRVAFGGAEALARTFGLEES